MRSRPQRPPSKVANLRAVAKLAGCSTATVSKALNGLPVSAENLEKVRAAAEQLGYVPNSAARSIRGEPTMTIGIVMNLQIHPQQELMAVLHPMIAEVERHGYSVFLSIARDVPDSADTLLRRFVERRVDGLFFWNATGVKSLSWYRRVGIPVLAIGFRDEGCADLPLLSAEGAPAYRQLFERLRQLGHRVVGEYGDERVSVVHHASAVEAGLDYRYLGVGYARPEIDERMREFLSQPDPPTAVLAPYPIALNMLGACTDLGISVPDDLSLVAGTDSDAAPLLRVPLSALHTDYVKIGEAAAAAMLGALDGSPLVDSVVHGSIEWVERASTGPAPAGIRS